MCGAAFLMMHLAPHTGGLQQRNVQARQLLQGLHINSSDFPLDISTDHVFVFGDLNYRLVEPNEMPEVFGSSSLRGPKSPQAHEEIINTVNSSQWASLLRADQLKQAIASGMSFDGFEEGQIDFKPTFKLKRFVSNFPRMRTSLARLF